MTNCETNCYTTTSPHYPGMMMPGSHAGQPGPGLLGGLCFMIAVGAAIYLVRHAHGFWGVAWAVVRAIFWPVVVGYWMMSRLLPTAHVKPSPKGLEAPAAALRAPKAKSK